jgi:hypothetical protein
MARMTQTVSQSISHATDTIVAFDSLAFDTTSGRMPNLGSNVLTCSTPGAYLITGSMRFNSAAGTSFEQSFNFTLAHNLWTKMSWYGITVTGRWALSGAYRFNGGNYPKALAIDVNGVTLAPLDMSGGSMQAGSVSITRDFVMGDEVQFWGYQASGGNLASAGDGVTPSFIAKLVTGTERYISLWKNGNTNLRLAEANTFPINQVGALSVSTIASLVQGDTIGLYAFQASGGNLPSAPGFNDIHLSMALLSPA